MKKRTFGLFMAGVMALGLCACGGNGGDNSENVGNSGTSGGGTTTQSVTIEFFGWGDTAEQENYQKLINQFMAENEDVIVVYKGETASTYMTTLTNRANNLPDLFYMPDYDFLEWVANGMLLDISSYVEQEDLDKLWPEAVDEYYFNMDTMKLGKSDGAGLYGLPKDLGPFTLVYNKTLLDSQITKLGLNREEIYGMLNPTDPMTWQEFRTLLKTVDPDPNDSLFGVSHYELEAAVYSNNANFFNEDASKERITDPNFIEAVQFIVDLTTVDHVMPTAAQQVSTNGYQRFKGQGCIFSFMGPWDCAEFWKTVTFDYDILPVPYVDNENYASVSVDFNAKTVTLSNTKNGAATVVATGTLVNDFSPSALHTVRVAVRDGVADVTFDNMTKIDNASLTVSAGKVGYKSLADGATVGYTAFSNVAMGMSDQREAKQAKGIIGASAYLYEDTYGQASKLGESSVVSVLEEGSAFDGAKTLTLGAKGDYASYLVNFNEDGRYGLELVYRASDGGKKIGVKLADGTVWRYTLPVIETEELYVKAIVGELNAEAGISLLRLENVGDEVNYVSFRFVEVSNVTPVYEQSLDNYASTGADYKTIWKIKDGGHYAKAGTRQLVYFGDNTITDFTLEVEIKLEGSTGTSTAGIVFHAKNYAASSHDNYTSMQGYYLAVNNNQIVLERLNYADDTRNVGTFVQNNPFATSDVFVPIKIQVRGNTITVWSGETKMIEVTDSNAFTHGKIGLYTNGAAAVFRNLKVSA